MTHDRDFHLSGKFKNMLNINLCKYFEFIKFKFQ